MKDKAKTLETDVFEELQELHDKCVETGIKRAFGVGLFTGIVVGLLVGMLI